MNIGMRVALVLAGCLGIIIYFRSIIRMVLLNRRERDVLGRAAGRFAVTLVQGLSRDKRSYEDVQRLQAWVMPLFIFTIVSIWFLLVQLSFSFILWGVSAEPDWLRAFLSSGSALSTLGYLTPKTSLGEALATFEAAIGLGIVMLLFTFVPGYQAAIVVRERKVGWLDSRAGGRNTACVSLLESLHRAGRTYDANIWEEWEAWFRGLLETHSISPVLAYVPSVYRGGSWLATSAAVLDAASLLLVSAEPKDAEAARICRETGVTALRTIAAELVGARSSDVRAEEHRAPAASAALVELHGKLPGLGLPVAEEKDRWAQSFMTLRADYASHLRRISAATLMPFHEPWERPRSDESLQARRQN